MSFRLWLAPGALTVPLDESGANPVIVALLFVVRCLVPLALMLGVSFVLRKLGLIRVPPPSNDDDHSLPPTQGGQSHDPA
jgi:hypothetical protein